LDVYEPPSGVGPFRSIILFHGGAWRSGCKAAVAPTAARLAASGFVVFTPDFRMDCDPLSPPPDVDDRRQCGFHATTPIVDARTAIHWVRASAARYGGLGTSVAAFGGSSGGNLAYMTAVTGVPGDTAPDAVVGW